MPYPPGGSTDILARLVVQRLSKALGQPVVVDNRGGASGSGAGAYFAKMLADNHAFLVTSLPMMAINQYLYPKLGYDPDADFVPIGLMGQTPNVMEVSPALPVKTMRELADYAKANPGKLSYSSSSMGSAGHLLNELFKANTGIDLLHVDYRGNGPAMQALLAGEVQITTDNLPQMLPQIRAGKLHALAVTAPKRWFQLPDVPTVAETGFTNMNTTAWFGLVAQEKTAPEIVSRMNRELNLILKRPDFAAKLARIHIRADARHARRHGGRRAQGARELETGGADLRSEGGVSATSAAR
ncbi:MAG: tripartite tricarboxylate transporter substrate binding protein [Candidatus Protistobacter heckmanni]|nr:tripartite tricarboxylate transporter substrate binding protein [Candidatus Protistobacter heckmanni]